MAEWRSIPGFDGYEVSNDGAIRRVQAGHGAIVGRLLTPWIGRGGYPKVRVARRDGGTTTIYVHRAVALAFLGEPPSPAHEVNHKDRNKFNPNVANLEWVTRAENNEHARATGVRVCGGEDRPNHKLTWDDVDAIRASTEGTRALGRRYGVHHMTIVNIRRGRKWKIEERLRRTLA